MPSDPGTRNLICGIAILALVAAGIWLLGWDTGGNDEATEGATTSENAPAPPPPAVEQPPTRTGASADRSHDSAATGGDANEGNTIQVWKRGDPVGSIPESSKMRKETQDPAALTTEIAKQWLPAFTGFVTEFGKTATKQERKTWKKRVVRYVANNNKLSITVLDPSLQMIPAGQPTKYEVTRVADLFITMTVTYPRMKLVVSMNTDPENNDQWRVGYWELASEE